jgi:hypothetical protein
MTLTKAVSFLDSGTKESVTALIFSFLKAFSSIVLPFSF